MEADLQIYCHTDYRDRWHPDRRRRLTLRRLWVLIDHLPPKSATIRALNGGRPPLERIEVLAADIWGAVAKSKRPHPIIADAQRKARSATRQIDPARQRRLQQAKLRKRDRDKRIAAGEIR